MKQPLEKTLIDAAAFLTDRSISYALVGGLAASFRGQPRLTADVDAIIGSDVHRALALVDELDATKFAPLFPQVKEVVERSFILPLRHRTTAVKVDLALGLSGFEQQAIRRAKPIVVAGHNISVATAEDLIIFKTLAARPQDDQDLRGLVAAQGRVLDWEYCLDIAAQLEEAIGHSLVHRVQVLKASAQRNS